MTTSGRKIGRPLRRAEARKLGLTDSDLTGPSFRRVYQGVYVTAQAQPTIMERARAALHVSHPGSYVSHHTAAAIWRGVAPADGRIHVSVLPGRPRSKRRGIAAHRSPASPEVRTIDGMEVSTPSRCFCELAADGVGVVDLVVLGDSLVKAQEVTTDQLVDAAERWPGRGRALARRAAHLVRPEVDSPKESRLRMLIVLGGLPEPTVNYVLRHPNGDWKARFDLCYPDLRLVIEYDGDQHITDPRQHARDLERREELERLGWRFVVIEKHHIYQRPGQILGRIRQARLDRGARAATCRLRSTWMSEFTA